MAKGLYDSGEEDLIRAYFDPNFTPPSTLYVGLFLDSSDALADDAVESDISTEPTDGNYARTALDVGTDFALSFNTANNFQAVASNVDVTVGNVTQQEVDSWFIADDTQANGGTLLSGGSLAETVTVPGPYTDLQIGDVGLYIA